MNKLIPISLVSLCIFHHTNPMKSGGNTHRRTYVKPAPDEVHRVITKQVAGSRFVGASLLETEITNAPGQIAFSRASGLFTKSVCLHEDLAGAITENRSEISAQQFAEQTRGMNTEQQYRHLLKTSSVGEAKGIAGHEIAHLVHGDLSKMTRDKLSNKLGFISDRECFARSRMYEYNADDYVMHKKVRGRSRSPETKRGYVTFLEKLCHMDQKKGYIPSPLDSHPFSCDRAERAAGAIGINSGMWSSESKNG